MGQKDKLYVKENKYINIDLQLLVQFASSDAI